MRLKSLIILSIVTFLSLFAGIPAQAQYGGGTTIFFNPASGTTTTTSTTTPTTTGTALCPNSTVSSSVAGDTATINLCKVKAGNTITINNLNTSALESIQFTFSQDLDNGVFQIVKIPQSLTYPNLPGNFITGFELLTVNFNRNIIQTVTLNYKVNNSLINQSQTYNAYISNSPWVSTSVTKTSQDSSFTRFTSTSGVFTQYALTSNSVATNTTSVTTSTTQSSVNNTDLIRTGGNTSILAYSAVLISALLVTAAVLTRKKNLFKSVLNGEQII